MINKIDVSIVSAGIISSMEPVDDTLIIVYVSISEVTVFPVHLDHSWEMEYVYLPMTAISTV